MNSKTSPVDSSPILSCERTSVSLFFFITLTFQAHSPTPEHLWLGADIIETTADGACTGVFYWAPECFQTRDFEGNMHGYALGAFRNARPTQIMRSFTRASRLMSGK